MKAKYLAAAAAFLVMAGCETMQDPLIQRDTVYNDQGIYIYSELSESYGGDRYWNFWAQNNNSYPICIGASLGPGSTTSGHSFDGVHYVAPGETEGIGYVYAPADYTLDHGAWNPDEYGNCD